MCKNKFVKTVLKLVPIILLSCQAEEKTIPNFDCLDITERPDLSWIEQVGARLSPNNKKTFIVNDFNADNNGEKPSTDAIQKAIDACHDAGGGIVSFKPGSYLTGAVFVKSGVNLHIDNGVTLLASIDDKDYPEIQTRIAGIEMTWPAAVINIIDQQNAMVSGGGTIDCRGEVWWDKYWTMRKDYEQRGLRWIVDYDCKRVRGMLVSNSSDVTLCDFNLMRSGFWGIQVLYSNQCTVKDVNINNNVNGKHGPSTDGIDIDSSTRILIDGCTIDCNDDNICLKSGRDADGLRVNRPTEYIVIRNCTTLKGGGMITCGSETSGGINNIVGYNLKANGTSAVLRMKSAMTRGGTVSGVYVTDVVADSVKNLFAADLNWNPKYSYSTLPDEYEGQEIPAHWKTMLTQVEPKEKGYPHFRNIYLANVKSTNTQTFVSAAGWSDDLRIENFGMYNIVADAKIGGKVVYSDNFRFDNVKLKTEEKVVLENNNNLKDSGLSY